MGGSKVGDLQTMISKMMKTTNQQDRMRVRYVSPREEEVNRCLASLIHAISCKEGATCTAYGCLKMKRVVEHTRTCQRKTPNIRECPICSQLMSLCFYHSKFCPQTVCQVPFCRIIKRKLQAISDHQASIKQQAMQQNTQSLKGVPQFVIPPINPPPSSPPSNSRRDINSSASSEPSPKRLRLDDLSSSVNHEAQHSVMINNVTNTLATDQAENAQQMRSTAFV